MRENKLKRNIFKIYLLGGLWMFLLPMAILVPFFNSRSLSMEQVFQLQAFFSFCVLVLEIPSGYISDMVGRKGTLILAGLFHGAGFAMFPYCQDFLTFCIAEFLLAIAVSLFSGTDVALLYDSLDELDLKSNQSGLLGKKVFIYQMGETSAALIGGFLAGYSLDLPVKIHAFTSWLPVLVALTLTEPNREKFSAKSHQDNFKEIKNALFSEDRLVRFILLNAMVWGASTLIAVWTFQPYWKGLGFDIKAFGLLWAMINLIVGLTGKYAKNVEESIGAPKTLLLMSLLPILGYLSMGFIASLWGALFCLCFQVSRGLNQVIVRDALNSRVHGKMRATANSVASLGTRVIFIFLGPMMGYMMDNQGSQNAYFIFAGIFSLCLIIFMLPLLAMRDQFKS